MTNTEATTTTRDNAPSTATDAITDDRLALVRRMFAAVEPLPERDRNLIIRTMGGDPAAAIKEAWLLRAALGID